MGVGTLVPYPIAISNKNHLYAYADLYMNWDCFPSIVSILNLVPDYFICLVPDACLFPYFHSFILYNLLYLLISQFIHKVLTPCFLPHPFNSAPYAKPSDSVQEIIVNIMLEA